MTHDGYVILAYVLGGGLLWGYAGLLWLSARALKARTTTARGNGGGGK